LLGGGVLYLLSLIGTRTVTVSGHHRLGVSLKLGAVAILGALLPAESLLRPVAVAGGLAGILAAVVIAERTLIPPSQAA
jgi:hypothetical protein